MKVLVAVVITLWAGAAAAAPTEEVALRLQQLEEQVRALSREIETLRSQAAAPAPARDAELERKVEALTEEITRRSAGVSFGKPLESKWGLGPAASKVYGIERGVSIGGYGEMLYTAPSGGKDSADFLRAILYTGYRFNDRILFNSEVELEHANTEKSGAVELEFAHVDFLLHDAANLRAGMMLVPVGFINEMHEPTTFWSARRPALERSLIPSTWSENGLGFFGEAGRVSYKAYVLAGLDARGFGAATGIREGRQAGSKSLAEDLAVAARLDVDAGAGVQLGFSGYVGGSGQGAKVGGGVVDARVELWDAHLAWRWKGFGLRALYTQASIGDAADVNALNGLAGDDSVGSLLRGWYAEAGYDVLASLDTDQELTLFARHESFDTQADVPAGFLRDPANDRELWTLGAAYKPHPQVVIKLDWTAQRDRADVTADEWGFAVGYEF